MGVRLEVVGLERRHAGNNQPECSADKRLGVKVRDRLRQLLAGGYWIEWKAGRV
jgi:hypothetical protein